MENFQKKHEKSKNYHQPTPLKNHLYEWKRCVPTKAVYPLTILKIGFLLTKRQKMVKINTENVALFKGKRGKNR
jgi:hypothetical protein